MRSKAEKETTACRQDTGYSKGKRGNVERGAVRNGLFGAGGVLPWKRLGRIVEALEVHGAWGWTRRDEAKRVTGRQSRVGLTCYVVS